MKRRIAVLAVLLTIIVLVGTEVIGVAEANPYAFSKQINAPSGAIAPIISIDSPKSNTAYICNFNITFSVKRIQYSDYFSEVAHVTYTIDNQSFSIPLNGKDVLSLVDYNTSFIAPTLASGNHTLTVRATGIAFKPMDVYFTMDSISQVNFSTAGSKDIINPAPSPTIPEFPIAGILLVLAVASVSLVYFKRFKSKPLRDEV
jgi:hypothetical protein